MHTDEDDSLKHGLIDYPEEKNRWRIIFLRIYKKIHKKRICFYLFFVTLHSSIETDTALQATSPIDFVREIPMLIISEYVKKRTLSLINQ